MTLDRVVTNYATYRDHCPYPDGRGCVFIHPSVQLTSEYQWHLLKHVAEILKWPWKSRSTWIEIRGDSWRSCSIYRQVRDDSFNRCSTCLEVRDNSWKDSFNMWRGMGWLLKEFVQLSQRTSLSLSGEDVAVYLYILQSKKYLNTTVTYIKACQENTEMTTGRVLFHVFNWWEWNSTGTMHHF